MTYPYRCSRCRTRNLFARPVEKYVRQRKCRDCGHTSFYVDRERATRRPCRCDGAYHWGPHRKGSPCCVHRRGFEAFRAVRAGADEIDMALAGIGGQEHQLGAECPF